MATALAMRPYAHIELSAEVRAGKVCIAETRVAVVDVVIAHQQGYSPEEVCTHFSSRPLTIAEVHAHYDHPEELEGYLQRSELAEREIEAAKADYLRRETGR